MTATGGKPTTKDVDINLPKGDKEQTIVVPQPEITAVVEPPAGAAPAAAPTSSEGKAGEGKSTSEGKSTTEGKSGGTETQPAPARESFATAVLAVTVPRRAVIL